MREVKCEIVRDLLVSYQNQMLTDETATMLEEHLAECENCRKKYKNLKVMWEEEENEEKARGKQFQQKLLEYRTYGIGFFIGLFLPVIILVGLFFIQVLYVAVCESFMCW